MALRGAPAYTIGTWYVVWTEFALSVLSATPHAATAAIVWTEFALSRASLSE